MRSHTHTHAHTCPQKEMTHLVKCLLCKYKDPEFESEHPCKELGMGHMALILELGRQRV